MEAVELKNIISDMMTHQLGLTGVKEVIGKLDGLLVETMQTEEERENTLKKKKKGRRKGLSEVWRC